MRSPRLSKLVFLVTVLFAIAIVRLWPRYDADAEFFKDPETMHLARSVAFHHQFADPFRPGPTGPSAYLSPAFPAFLAWLIAAFGTGAKAAFAIRFAATVAAAAELALLPVLTEVIGIGPGVGVLSCAMGLLSPIFTFPKWEMSYAGLLIVIATILWWIFLTDPDPRFVTTALLGFVSGVLLLTSPTTLPVLSGWFGYSAWKFRRKIFRRGRWAAALIVIAILIPWTVRNYFVFHHFIPFRTALGVALEVSENDCALVGVRQSEASGCYALHSPNRSIANAALARALGEADYNSLKLHETIRWVMRHPHRFATLTWQRTFAFWFPHEANSLREEVTTPKRRGERLTIYLATILSLPGFLLLIKSHREGGLLLGSWLVLFPPIYYFALFEDRYRYPILWVTFVCAAYALYQCRPLLEYCGAAFHRCFLRNPEQCTQ